MIASKSCLRCKFLKKYTSKDGFSYLNVCEAEEAECAEDDGLWLVTVVDIDEFDPSYCLNFKPLAEVEK